MSYEQNISLLDDCRSSWGVTTSGIGGRSFTRGIASAVTVIAANALKRTEDLSAGEGIVGALICQDKLFAITASLNAWVHRID
ncbi:MAG: hypothetical protein PVF29_08470 [Desulfobacterales bacterium]|jgi:hypothetical protein